MKVRIAVTPLVIDCYRWIFEKTMQDGYQPSYRETVYQFQGRHSRNPNVIWQRIDALQEEGFLWRAKGSARALRFLKKPDGTPFEGFIDREAPDEDHGPRRLPTDRQLEIYAWIYDETRRQGYQPSTREMARNFGINFASGMACHLDALQETGYLGTSGEGWREVRALRFLLRPDGLPFRGFAAP